MNGLKKWMVVLMTGVTLMGNVIGMGTTVIASKMKRRNLYPVWCLYARKWFFGKSN